jgi:hypothetical protein
VTETIGRAAAEQRACAAAIARREAAMRAGCQAVALVQAGLFDARALRVIEQGRRRQEQLAVTIPAHPPGDPPALQCAVSLLALR